jgi:hypothetical protein
MTVSRTIWAIFLIIVAAIVVVWLLSQTLQTNHP